MAVPGAILPAWGYYRDPPQFAAAGNYFLGMAAGVALSPALARAATRWNASAVLAFACSLSAAALIYVALAPAIAWRRTVGLLALGLGAGLFNRALFHDVSASYFKDAAGTLIRGGIWFGLGCLAAAVVVAETVASPTTAIILLAAVPAIFAVLFGLARTKPSSEEFAEPCPAKADLRGAGAILFGLLLFFQFGNEWSIAGWLPIFLIRRIGMSPAAGLGMLALYWIFLTAGRVIVAAVLPRIRHGWLLGASILAALFGCTLLFSTNNAFGAAAGVLFLGGGYASIYPLLAGSMGRRFKQYDPAFSSGMFSVAIAGGMLAPATLGYAASIYGVGVMIGIPLLGTCMVLLLLLLASLEARLAA